MDIAPIFAAGQREDSLAEIVELPHGAPSHDSPSQVFRLLDPEEMAGVFARFMDALREALGIGGGGAVVVAVDGGSLRRAYERGRALHACAHDQRLGRRNACPSPPAMRPAATRSPRPWRR